MAAQNTQMRTCHAYQGTKPYLFISYAHKDSAAVLAVVNELIGRKYRVWYDEGIEVGAEWPEVIAGRLANASQVLVFSSEAFVRSQNCTREINYAVDRKKPLSHICLDGTVPEGGMGMQLSVAPTVDARAKSAREICSCLEELGCLTGELLGDGVEGYTAAPRKRKKSFNKWMAATAVFALLFAGAAVLALGLTQGWFSAAGIQSETVTYAQDTGKSDETFTYTVWNDPVSRDLLLSRMNSPSVYLCGNAFVSAADAIDYRDGAWRLGDTAVQQGSYTDFSSMAEKGNITQLAMVYQALTDLSSVTGLPELTYLDISGNSIQDLSALKNLTQLKVLKLIHMPSADLTSLTELPALQRVYISVDMVGQAADLLHADFDIIIRE